MLTPLNVPAFLQALSTCETMDQLSILEKRLDDHGNILNAEERRNVKDAIKTQVKVIEATVERAVTERLARERAEADALRRIEARRIAAEAEAAALAQAPTDPAPEPKA
jgi:hypothetical protein